MNQEVEGRPLILYAADYGQKAVIEYLIAAGADVNVSELSLPKYHLVIPKLWVGISFVCTRLELKLK